MAKPKKKPRPAAAPPKPRLAVRIDGKELPEDEAREIWIRFSLHMDEHEGDLAGFAAANGWSSLSPEYQRGQAVLVVTRVIH
jgi:hypothetical protein